MLAMFPEAVNEISKPYAVSKSTLTGLTKVLAAPLAFHRIRINCIAPGPTDTRFLKGYFHQIFPGETELRPAKTLFQR